MLLLLPLYGQEVVLSPQPITPREQEFIDPITYFEELGVSFPAGSSVEFNSFRSILLLRNTAQNLARITTIIRQDSPNAEQVRIAMQAYRVAKPADWIPARTQLSPTEVAKLRTHLSKDALLANISLLINPGCEGETSSPEASLTAFLQLDSPGLFRIDLTPEIGEFAVSTRIWCRSGHSSLIIADSARHHIIILVTATMAWTE